jgi:hypothetical protein
MGRAGFSRVRVGFVVALTGALFLTLLAGGLAARAAPPGGTVHHTLEKLEVTANDDEAGSYTVAVRGQLELLGIGVPEAPVVFSGTNISGAAVTTNGEGVYETTITATPSPGIAAAVLTAKALEGTSFTETESNSVVIPFTSKLTVKVIGTGEVGILTSPSLGFCSSQCDYALPYDRSVELVSVDGRLPRWSGCSAAPCIVDMTKDYVVTADFAPPPRPMSRLTVTLNDASLGSVTSEPPGINCPGVCDHRFLTETPIVLTSAPKTAAVFTAWNRCGSAPTCRFVLNRDRTFSANFAPIITPEPPVNHSLTVTIVGPTGGGRVFSLADGIDCHASCTASFPHGKTLEVNIEPRGGVKVASVEGDCAGQTAQCELVLDQARLILVRLAAAPDPPRPPTSGEDACPIVFSCVPTIGTLFDGPDPPISWVLLIMLMFALIGFPAALFNATYEENEDRIHRRARAALRLPPRPPVRHRPWALAIAVLAVGALYLLAEQGHTAANAGQGLAIVVGWAAAFAVVSLAMRVPEAMFAGRPPRFSGTLRVLPTGFVIAGLCAAVSYTLKLNPGYLYGAIAGFALTAGRRNRDDVMRAAPISAGFLTAMTLVGFWLWSSTKEWLHTEAPPSLWKLAVAEFAVGLLIASAETMVFDFLPVRFLHGERLWTWSRNLWTFVHVGSLFVAGVVVSRILAHDGQFDIPLANLISAFVAVFAFGLLSIWFWDYCRTRAPGKFGEFEDESVGELVDATV